MSKRFSSQGLLFTGLVVLIILIALPILTYPMGRDQGMYANIGVSILSGGTPFVDVWDIKPPPIYYIYAVGIRIFGQSTEAIRAIDILLVPIGMLGLFAIGKRLNSTRIGLLSALLYGAFYFNDGFQNLSQSDSLATIPAIWLGYWTIRTAQTDPRSREAWLSALTTGAISGVLLWFKPQQYAFIVGAIILYQIIIRLRNGNRLSLVGESIAFAVGGLLTGGTLLLYFWSQGMIAEILIVAEGTSAYNAQGYDASAFINNMSQGLYFRATVWHGLFVLVGLGLLTSIWHIIRKNKQSPEMILFVLWLVAGLAFAFVQAKGFDTHWFPMLPPMALIGAIGLHHILPTQRNLINTVVHSLLVIAILSIPMVTTWGRALPFITGQQNRYDYWDTFQANDLKPEESFAVTAYLQERVQRGDSLFIWGFRPEVYYMAQLRPATRYQAHFPLVAPWYPTEWQQNNVDILWAAMPPYALILEDDFMPWVTDFDADSHTLLQDYTELNNWLIANYERVDEIGDFIIWKRADL
ncbi:MAG: glycosyltransferase family 39 protein [Chloroflexota bacterium]